MRIVTRGDFDSLISSVLLSLVHEIDELKITSPDEILYKPFALNENDILVNLPYQKGCGLWFDHHLNEDEKAHETDFKGAFKVADSCSRVIFDYYNDHDKFQRFEKIVEITDTIDSAQFSREDIQNPHDWFIIERTLHAFDKDGRLGDFSEYFIKLIHWIKSNSLSQILMSDEVQQRIELVRSEHKIFIDVLRECSQINNNIIFTDSRKIRYFPNGNRYLIYTLFPDQNVSVSIFNKRNSDTSVIFCGHNIFNQSCKTDINELLKKYNGSGRARAGTCIVYQNKADEILKNIMETLKENG